MHIEEYADGLQAVDQEASGGCIDAAMLKARVARRALAVAT